MSVRLPDLTNRHPKLACALVVICAAGACSGIEAPTAHENEERIEELGAALVSAASTSDTPIGLVLELENGSGVPLEVRAGQTFYISQIELRALVSSNVDEGVQGLAERGDFAKVPWGGVEFEEEQFQLLPNAAGKFTRSRFYRGATWIKAPSVFTVTQVNEQGLPTAPPIVVHAGMDGRALPTDDFFIRRFRALQWTYDCPASGDCTGATDFAEEAIIELRNPTDKKPTFKLRPGTKALRVGWSMKPGDAYTVPLEQVSSPPYDYGFSIDLTPLTPPGPDGYYLPGQDITFRVTYRDGAGNRLHPEGSLPSYNEVLFGANEAGLQYYTFEPAWVYWRRKHYERVPIVHLMGPAHKVQPLRNILPLPSLLGQDIQVAGLPERDGVFAAWKLFPATDVTFGGGFDPQHTLWALPGSDTFTFHLPDNVEPGTYRVTSKARRKYYGEEVPFTRTIEIQVGTATPTTTPLGTGKCNTCHTGAGSLFNVLHANPNRGTCAGCHAPLAVEYDAPIFVRVHFLHSRSNRVEGNMQDCSTCHLSSESIQRTSKAACLSCHTSYPADHVANFGSVHDIYVGGGAESFESCTTSCHTTHPGYGG